ncbi:MAG: hypothetical protein HY036_10465 [Nitrospirae bacterium]|nr:hypothetical protein [Nitrospirota bacterium]
MKKWHQSKTIWFNLLFIIIAVGGYFSGAVDINAGLTAGIIAIFNVGLRLVAKKPIG